VPSITRRRPTIARRDLEDDAPVRPARVAIAAGPGYCACPEPLTDADAGAFGSDDVDVCWRCRRPIDLEAR
jgi:hypothetical protein